MVPGRLRDCRCECECECECVSVELKGESCGGVILRDC